MHLAEFIRANIEPIAREWEEFAKTCTPAAIGMTRSGLLDDVTQILRAVAEDMEQPQTPAEQEAKGRSQRSAGPLGSAASSHVSLRIDSRFDLVQIVSEYRAMRASVVRLWARSLPNGLSEETSAAIRFDEAIDESIAEIVPEPSTCLQPLIWIRLSRFQTPMKCSAVSLAAPETLSPPMTCHIARSFSTAFLVCPSAPLPFEAWVDMRMYSRASRSWTNWPIPLLQIRWNSGCSIFRIRERAGRLRRLHRCQNGRRVPNSGAAVAAALVLRDTRTPPHSSRLSRMLKWLNA
jgi:hypothetical protein